MVLGNGWVSRGGGGRLVRRRRWVGDLETYNGRMVSGDVLVIWGHITI